MPESLVAFMTLYGLGWTDIVQLPLKVRTGAYKGPKKLPQAVRSAIADGSYSIQLSEAVYTLANTKLDAQVSGIVERCGNEAWAQLLQLYGKLQQAVEEQCHDTEQYIATGMTRYRDNGLGYRCVEAVVRQELLAIGRW